MGNDTINKHNQQKQLKTLICGHCWRLQCNETTAISRIFMQFMHVHCCFAKPSAEAGHLIISKQTTLLDPIFIVCRHYYTHEFKLSLKIQMALTQFTNFSFFKSQNQIKINIATDILVCKSKSDWVPYSTCIIEILSYFFILESLTTSKMRKFQTIKLYQFHKAKTLAGLKTVGLVKEGSLV